MLRLTPFIAAFVVTLAPAVTKAAVESDLPANGSLDRAAVAHLIQGITTELRAGYVLQTEGEKAAEVLEGALAAKAYDKIADTDAFASKLTTQLQDLTGDSHVRVIAGSPFAGPTPSSVPPSPDLLASRLDTKTGYIKLKRFPPPEDFKPAIDKAMHDLVDTSAMIIDIRGNGGGHPASVAYLASFFLPADMPVHLNDLIWRNRGTSTFRTEQFWSSATPVTYIDKPVYVLVSSKTYSAAEEFAYDMQVLRRATIVGEGTRGGANPGGLNDLGFGVFVVIPTGKARNPMTKTNWGGTGVQPDIRVAADLAQETAVALADEHLPRQR